MDIGKQNLVVRHPLVLLGKQLFHLVIEICLFPDGLTVRDDRPGRLVLGIGKPAARAGSCFDIDSVSMPYDFLYSGRDRRNPKLIVLYLLEDANYHRKNSLLLLVNLL